jgi:hypothetical protein
MGGGTPRSSQVLRNLQFDNSGWEGKRKFLEKACCFWSIPDCVKQFFRSGSESALDPHSIAAWIRSQ